jgi:glycine/D-amino acid oxidase-like deaminating enzyme/nitrite reductase/ring-hydroxylating ferredoxin subunit
VSSESARPDESVPVWHTQLSDSDRAAIAQPWLASWPDRPVDAVIVGGGMTGLSTAYHLLERGLSVVVLEMNELGSGETGRTTAHLATALDDRYHVLEQIHGAQHAMLAAQSHAAAIASIERICETEAIACDFRRVNGYLFAGPGGSSQLQDELAAARRAGLDVSWCHEPPLPFTTDGCLRFAEQAELQPLVYLLGLARAITRLGGRIFTHTRMLQIESLAASSGVRVHVQGHAPISAHAVVVATNTPVNDRIALHTKQAAYRSYVIGIEIPAGTVERALYWDTLDPYHYLRLAADDLLLVGGEDHKVGQSSTPYDSWLRLESWAREHFAGAGQVRSRRSGQIQEPDDGLAFIGRNPGSAKSNVFVASGDSGNGMTHGALAGILLSTLILGEPHAWAEVYEPSRKITQPTALRDFVRENVNVGLHYAQWLSPRKGPRTVPPGQGAVVREGLHRVALYVDDAGREHRCSAVCPHLGCLVAWNGAERSWDCPCHGSRFDAYGKLLIGPSNDDLTALPPRAQEEPAQGRSAKQ